MEQIVIFALFVIASIVSSIIQNKKKQAEERRLQGDVPPPPVRPAGSWPASARDWQEQLKRMLEGQMQPPITRPVIVPDPPRSSKRAPIIIPPPLARELSEGEAEFKSPLPRSSAAYKRASQLQANVQERFRSFAQRTTTHRPSVSRVQPRPVSPMVQRLRQNPAAVREAFIASLIFGPPKSLEN